jgi:murein DD-endopeptidase MepM/ murein hydrolase activator NlpD
MTLRLLNRAAIFLAALLLLAACQSVGALAPTLTPDGVSTARARASWTPIPVVAIENSPIPTQTASVPTALPPAATFAATATATTKATLVPSPTALPITAVPTNTARPTFTLAPTTARTTISTLVPGPFGGSSATWTPPASGRKFKDHYVFRRPIGDSYTNYWARNYSYGSTDGGTRPTHHGVDIPNETGTPVLAAGDGIIYYAGPDKEILFGPQPNFYGNVIVIEHPLRDADGQTIYTLYGHLSKIEVANGQLVKAGQEIGLVGAEGVAIGSHLHFEVRSGKPNDYNSTRNPELWIMPYQGYGVLAGRVLDLNGIPITGIEVEVQSPDVYRFAYSYADNTVNGDLAMGENFAVPDLPPGYYTVFVKLPSGGLKFRTLFYIYPGRTNWIDINIDLN